MVFVSCGLPLRRHLPCHKVRSNDWLHGEVPIGPQKSLQSVPNPENDSPATFLAKRRPPAGIQYKRITPRFFAVSSIRNGRTWYNRCNRVNEYMNCVLINYPAAEEREWDAVVTRISLSLGK